VHQNNAIKHTLLNLDEQLYVSREQEVEKSILSNIDKTKQHLSKRTNFCEQLRIEVEECYKRGGTLNCAPKVQQFIQCSRNFHENPENIITPNITNTSTNTTNKLDNKKSNSISLDESPVIIAPV